MIVQTMIDIRGRQLVEGVRVAFNYSGDLAIGTITKVQGGTFHIKRETHANHSNPISKVKNARSLVAIVEAKDVERTSREIRNQSLQDWADANGRILRLIDEAWDLHDLILSIEELFGEDWREQISNTFESKQATEQVLPARCPASVEGERCLLDEGHYEGHRYEIRMDR